MASDTSDGELTDALLDLIDSTDTKKKRKRTSSSSKGASKRHKRDTANESESDDEPESEEDVENPYPLEGKYTDEADRLRIFQMPEVEREEILAQRAEELQRFQESFKLNQLVKQQAAGGADNVSSAAKRKHTVRGSTKTKVDKLSELRASRKAKDERRKAGREKHSSPNRAGSAISDDMQISSDDEEGEISKDQQLEEKARLVFGDNTPAETIKRDQLLQVQLTRNALLKHCMRPWFEEYVKGAFVRYLIGQSENEPVYRLCEVLGVATGSTHKPYRIDEQTVDQLLELKHGKDVKAFMMDKVSNTHFTEREFDRFIKVSEADKVPIPTSIAISRKMEQMKKFSSQEITESELNVILEKKKSLQPNRGQQALLDKVRLQQERNLALRREDFQEAERIERQLKQMEESVTAAAPNSSRVHTPDTNDLFAKINERNRQRNLEAIRKAEAEAAARKRAERKALASGAATPSYDPSARLKTVPKLFNNRSRGVTPNGPSTPHLTPPLDAGKSAGGLSPVPPLSMPSAAQNNIVVPKVTQSDFESKMLNVEIDLGDF